MMQICSKYTARQSVEEVVTVQARTFAGKDEALAGKDKANAMLVLRTSRNSENCCSIKTVPLSSNRYADKVGALFKKELHALLKQECFISHVQHM
jgi:hypothetical protein